MDKAKGWIFSEKIDLFVFLGPTVLGLLLYSLFHRLQIVSSPTPAWTIFVFLIASDGVHVFSTSLRTYLDKTEFQQRKQLFVLVPVICYVVGVFIYFQSNKAFYAVLTYLNVLHIVRQQYGWMSFSSRKAKEDRSSFGWKLDCLAIYNVTLYPLIWWHAHMPRPYKLQEEFLYGLPRSVSDVASIIFWSINGVYIIRQILIIVSGKSWNRTKFMIWGSTFITWYCSMILASSEFEFLVLGSLIHSIPYLALVFIYKNKDAFRKTGWILTYMALLFVAVIHNQASEYSKIYLPPIWLSLIVPFITLPYTMHYVLDAFIWRVNFKNPFLVKRLELS